MAKSFPILCGSIAGSIGGMGVKMHNSAFKHMNLPYTYVSFEPENVEDTIRAMRNFGIRGLGVTMPFKQAIIPYLDELDSVAQEIGAINTILNEDGKLKGYNTDCYGAITTLLEATDLTDKKVVVLGAGGAARTIIWGLLKYTKDIVVYNNNQLKGKDVAATFDVVFAGDIGLVSSDIPYDILINCTSVGFKSSETIITADKIRPNTVVLDVVFLPTSTTFLKEAKLVGCVTLSGTRMIMHQACKQFELYTGLVAPFKIYEKIMQEICLEK